MPFPAELNDYLTTSKSLTSVSLYSGAGGLDLGLAAAGVQAVFANDVDPVAVETHNKLFGSNTAIVGDIRVPEVQRELVRYFNGGADLVVGGPPCQSFSVAGKMDPNDPRSLHVFDFLAVVKAVRPRAFIMENVKALALNQRWQQTRNRLFRAADEMGYQTQLLLVNASHFGVPQARERMFMIGTLAGAPVRPIPTSVEAPPTVRSTLAGLPSYGYPGNDSRCTAKVTLAKKPVIRKSPYAGMLFNGHGRPLNLDRPASTLPASMGGNRTPIIDQDQLDDSGESWVEGYHARLASGKSPLRRVPSRLRRITVEEAAAIQTFPQAMHWAGRQSAQYRQIGNAVPPRLGYHIGQAVVRSLDGSSADDIESPVVQQLLISPA